MNTTISVESSTKKLFLAKKRKHCLKVNKDINANDYTKYLLGLDNGNNK